MSRLVARVVILTLHCCVTVVVAHAQHAVGEPAPPTIAPASAEGELALRRFRAPNGLRASLFAAEPMVANPVCFHIDDRGQVFVCESFRQNAGVTDNRGHDQAWLDDDLAAQSVADRLAYHQKHLGEKVSEYTQQDDRIRLLIDTDGDRRADQETVFSGGYNQIVDGTGAGVLHHDGDVFYTCIPHLWRLRDRDGDGRAEERVSLYEGFGVRVAFRGHDMHGLIVGPDGRLYFSIGDRGYNVETDQGRLKNPESGAVFRCELDGSNLEVIATGLRNPQELAFDDYGNLFTGDNNSDSGDQARWVYVVEGSDSGWRMSYQYLPDRGPFNREKIWHPFHDGQPAYIVPPITNLADGPSGLAFYPGTGLPSHFDGRFFLCDFRGGPANSGVRTFRLQRRGASFEVVDQEETIWNILATDVDFGPDGAVYVSDWVDGWNGEGKGRIYRFADATGQSPLAEEVASLLASDMGSCTSDRLASLLTHADRRVRLRAQFTLAARVDIETLLDQVARTDHQLARLHALWGLGQIARGESAAVARIAPLIGKLLGDEDADLRAQASLLLGEMGSNEHASDVIALLRDPDQRVRYFAAMSLGKLRSVDALPAVLRLLEENNDGDPIVRHGGIMAMVGMDHPRLVEATRQHHSRGVRVAAVVALRKLRRPVVAEFLDDTEPMVVVEAARAIHDLPLPEAMPQLAALITRSSQDEALWRRVLNANFRLGRPHGAQALAEFAARSDVPTAMRVEAVDMLANWARPSNRDRVLGMWRPLEERPPEVAQVALQRHLGEMLTGPQAVRARAARAASQLGLPEAGEALAAMFADQEQPAEVRGDAIVGLGKLGAEQAHGAIQAALVDEEPVLRAAARQALAAISPSAAVPELQAAIRAEHRIERQLALSTLAEVEHASATEAIESAMRELLAGKIPDDTQLDVLEAAEQKDSEGIRKLLSDYAVSQPGDDPLAIYRATLHGGDARRGEQIFFDRTDLSCVRCHKVGDRGGEVGPDLSKIAQDKKRDYLLEAIVVPDRAIAKNFESVVVVDDRGQIHTGILKSEDDDVLRIMTAEGKLVVIEQDAIEIRQPGKSAMPDDIIKKLNKRDLRDLVEFLARQK